MKTGRRFGWLSAALLVVAIWAGNALAQDPENVSLPPQQYPNAGNDAPPGQNAQDPPGRVARLQFMSGEVSLQPGGVNDWVAASLNRPLTTADRVWTDKNSKAELNVGDGFLRMNSETSVTLTDVSNSTVQVELFQGTLEVTVKHLEKGEIYEIDTPNFAFTVMKTGVYRFDVFPNGDESWATVRSGEGEATGKGPAVRVKSGQQARFKSDQTLQHTVYSAPAPDGFDDWAQVRDKRLENSVSARYVSPGVIGYQDLDGYGTWQTVPTYGAIWIPSSVPAGWAPYRYGHWVWVAPWGWTWVDDAPWGFAPFHYGRWVSWGGGWGWAPGPLGYWNPYYAPALVGWIGGPGFGVGFGWGGFGFGVGFGFGWYPLGWGAPYYPRYCGWGHGGWYHGGGWVSAGYLHNVNVTNTHITHINNITNNYYHGNFAGTEANRNIAGAVTAAPKSAFTSGAAINKVGMAVPKANLGRGQLLHNIDATPTRQSVMGASTAARSVPPASATNRSVVTRSTPPAGPARLGANQSAAARASSASAAQGKVNTAHAPMSAPGANQANAAPKAAPAAQGNVTTQRAPLAAPSANHADAARNVPRPPTAGGPVNNGTATNQVARDNVPSTPATHTAVPRTPGNDSFAHGNNSSVNNHATVNSPQATADAPAMQTSQVPRPPANYHAPSATPQQSAPTYHAPSAATPHESAPSHPSGPEQHAAPKNDSHSKSPTTTQSYGSAPRPPAGYTYHAAQAYSASSSYAAGQMGTSSYAGSNRSSYRSSSYYGSNRSYGSSPTYTARNYGSSGSYSAPHYSGGSGGGYHASGGGGHSGGGGGHR